MRLKAEFLKTTVSQVFNILIDIVGIEAEDTVWQQCLVVLLLF